MVLPIKHKKKNMLVRVLKSAWSYTVVETSWNLILRNSYSYSDFVGHFS